MLVTLPLGKCSCKMLGRLLMRARSWMAAKEGGQPMRRILCCGTLLKDLAALLGIAYVTILANATLKTSWLLHSVHVKKGKEE
jgi:hypothetical protein